MPVNVNERFEISMSERYAVHSMPMPHTHSFYELYYVVSGQCEFIADDISHTMVPDSVYIISQNIPHQTIYGSGADWTFRKCSKKYRGETIYGDIVAFSKL